MARNPKTAPEDAAPAMPPRDKIAAALMQLAGEQAWDEISITAICARAGVTLAVFREFFPSKGAVLASYARGIDLKVLAGGDGGLGDEPAKERLFDVLMRRLDAMAPDKAGIQSVMAWARRDPLAMAALNQVETNSMRFMLEAAGITQEGPLGALKVQGLALAWAKILAVWTKDEDGGLAATMAALDRELTRGGQFVARAEDVQRLLSPLHSFARALCDTRKGFGERMRERWTPRETGDGAAAP